MSNKEQLTLEDLNPFSDKDVYIQYYDKSINRVKGFIKKGLSTYILTENEDLMLDIIDCKLILRPLSDLTKPITHNGETFVPIEWLEEKYPAFNYREQCERIMEDSRWINQCEYLLVQQLLEWKFDIGGFILKRLAISTNSITEKVY